jgi:hypothetical protein
VAYQFAKEAYTFYNRDISGNPIKLANFDDVPASALAIFAGNGHCGVPSICGVGSNNQLLMNEKLAEWIAAERGLPPGSSQVPAWNGSVGVLSYRQFPVYLRNAVEGLSSTTPFKDPQLHQTLISNLSAAGAVGDLNGPAMNSYIAIAGDYCQALFSEISNPSIQNKRGFDRNGLQNLNLLPTDFDENLKNSLFENLTKRFWGRSPTALEATFLVGFLDTLFDPEQTLDFQNTFETTKEAAFLTCVMIASSPVGLQF